MTTSTTPLDGDDPWPAEGLTDGVVLLRAALPSDEEAWLAAVADPDVRRWSPPRDLDLAERRARFARMLDQDSRSGSVERFVASPADGRFLGLVDWRRQAPEMFRLVEVGYLTAPVERGRGVASRALALVVRWLLDEDGLGLHRVQLDHAVENVASCRTATRAGVPREGRMASFLPLAGPDDTLVFHDVCQHAVLEGT